MHRIQETVHFLNGVGDQYSLEVVAIFQTATDTGSDGIYVFEYRTIFDTRYVITDRCFDEAASQTTCEDTCFVFVRAGDSQVGEAFQGYFFCVAGTCKDCYIFWWYTIFFVKYSDTITLSSGTIPLIAVMINLSFILVFSFFRCAFR